MSEDTLMRLMAYYRTDLGINAEVRYADSLESLNQQLLAKHYQNHIRLTKLTNYFAALQQGVLASDNIDQCKTAYAELRRIYDLAAKTPGNNPNMASWANPKLDQVRDHINSLERTRIKEISRRNTIAVKNAPLKSNPCIGCNDPATCQANWAERQASIDFPTLYEPLCGGNCGDPSCGNTWKFALITKYSEGANHNQQPNITTDPPLTPVYPIETAVLGGRLPQAIRGIIGLMGPGNTPVQPGESNIIPIPEGFSRVEYPRGTGAANGPVPEGYVQVSRWIDANEAAIWAENGATRIPPNVGTVYGDRTTLYTTSFGAPRPGNAGPIRVDFYVPGNVLRRTQEGAYEWYQTNQPVSNTPIYNVRINYP